MLSDFNSVSEELNQIRLNPFWTLHHNLNLKVIAFVVHGVPDSKLIVNKHFSDQTQTHQHSTCLKTVVNLGDLDLAWIGIIASNITSTLTNNKPTNLVRITRAN